ncbi:hypothetical protein DMB37_37950 [Nocardia sp. CS682]|nr:hypothetical protein DMB37_37950 [Nocardia sp. CS682]
MLGVSLDAELLDRALTHRSFAHEHGLPHNERLEFVSSAAVCTSDAERGRRALAALRILLPEKRNRHSFTGRSDRRN